MIETTSLLIFAALGAVAGVAAGLFGIGGGLLLVAGLIALLPQAGIPASVVTHVALATALASIVATACASATAHARRGSVIWRALPWLVPGLLAGGLAGAWSAKRLPGEWLEFAVGVYCLIAAVQMAKTPRQASVASCADPVGPALLPGGFLIGALSAHVGIGGGSMTVPLLMWRGAAPVRAIGTSSACGVAIAIAAASGFILGAPPKVEMPPGSAGFVYLPAAIAIAIASVPCAPLGARLAHALPAQILRRSFAAFLAVVGVALLVTR